MEEGEKVKAERPVEDCCSGSGGNWWGYDSILLFLPQPPPLSTDNLTSLCTEKIAMRQKLHPHKFHSHIVPSPPASHPSHPITMEDEDFLLSQTSPPNCSPGTTLLIFPRLFLVVPTLWLTPFNKDTSSVSFFLTKIKREKRGEQEREKGKKCLKTSLSFDPQHPPAMTPFLCFLSQGNFWKESSIYTQSLLPHLPLVCQPLHSNIYPYPSTKITLVKITNNCQIAKFIRCF